MKFWGLSIVRPKSRRYEYDQKVTTKERRTRKAGESGSNRHHLASSVKERAVFLLRLWSRKLFLNLF